MPGSAFTGSSLGGFQQRLLSPAVSLPHAFLPQSCVLTFLLSAAIMAASLKTRHLIHFLLTLRQNSPGQILMYCCANEALPQVVPASSSGLSSSLLLLRGIQQSSVSVINCGVANHFQTYSLKRMISYFPEFSAWLGGFSVLG